MNEALQARVDKIEAELARREAKKTNSERQAAHVTGRGRSEDVAEDRDEREAWGDDDDREERGGSASRRQAARVTRGASRRAER